MTSAGQAALVTPLLGMPAASGWMLLTLVATAGLSEPRAGEVLAAVGATAALLWLASPWLARYLVRIAQRRGWGDESSFWAGTLGTMALCGVVLLATTAAALA